jgi:hypothetical protein
MLGERLFEKIRQLSKIKAPSTFSVLHELVADARMNQGDARLTIRQRIRTQVTVAPEILGL